MKRETIDLAALECARIGCPERWIRELVTEAGLPMSDRTWHRYYQAVTSLAQDATTGAPG